MSLNKINTKIQNLVSQLVELSNTEHSFDTRERMICANIKVDDWLEESDVLSLIEKLNAQTHKADILEEFNEDRLNSIYEHTCEDGINNLKDMYEGSCDISDFDKIFNVWNKAHGYISKYDIGENESLYDYCMRKYDKQKYYIKEYWNDALKFDTRIAFEKFIIKNNSIEYAEWLKRSHIDKFECWQYGRSGGWFSICSEDEANFECIVSDNFDYSFEDIVTIDNDKEFNEFLFDYCDSDKKASFVKELQSILDKANNKIAAITAIIKDIEDGKKYFKESLLDRLENEILEFINDNVLVSNCTIEVVNNKVVTDLGVSVPLNAFSMAYDEVFPHIVNMGSVLPIDKKVGAYMVERAYKTDDDVIIKAGCHRFSFNNIKEVMTEAKKQIPLFV